jgi:hypothetical protein
LPLAGIQELDFIVPCGVLDAGRPRASGELVSLFGTLEKLI